MSEVTTSDLELWSRMGIEYARAHLDDIAQTGTMESIRPLVSDMNSISSRINFECASTIVRIYQRLPDDDQKNKVVDLLLAALGNPSPSPFSSQMVDYADICYALGKIANPRAVTPLIEYLLKSTKFSIWNPIAGALAKIGDLQAVEPLVLILIAAANIQESIIRQNPYASGDSLKEYSPIELASELAKLAGPDMIEPLFEKYKADNPKAVELARDAYFRCFNNLKK